MCCLILSAGLLKYAVLIKLCILGLTPKATAIYNCFYEGTFAFFTHRHLLHSSFYLSWVLFRPRGHYFTLCQGHHQDIFHSLVNDVYPHWNINLHFIISYELYKHDKLMKMVLPPDAIKCRMKRNAIDLFSHACQFLLVLCFSFIWIASTRIFESFTLLFPMLFHNVQQVIHVIVHLSLRPQLRNGLKDLFKSESSYI